jgi:hypothetical protein
MNIERVGGHPIEFIDKQIKDEELLAFIVEDEDEGCVILPNGGQLPFPDEDAGFTDEQLIKVIWVVSADTLPLLVDFLGGFLDQGGDGDTIARLVRIIDRLTGE